MANRCDVCDPGCERQCSTECYRCGLPACRSCSSLVKYLDHGKKRICNNCMYEGIRHGESWAVGIVEVQAPPLGAELSETIKTHWASECTTLYQRALAKRGA